MDRALEEAQRAMEAGEVPVGAVVVLDGVIVATGNNRTRRDNDPTAHAEIVALRAAAKQLDQERLSGADLFVTLEPCAMCAGAISHARIRRLYYGAGDEKMGAVDHGPRFFAAETCHHRPEVYGGLAEEDAAAMLRGFFQARRS
ncbi:MAG: nucleoside deaminase [Hyphomicrobiaceae bacterium]|nr:nucleoside deaminase [Hyphomicrobiaceae bacterium]